MKNFLKVFIPIVAIAGIIGIAYRYLTKDLEDDFSDNFDDDFEDDEEFDAEKYPGESADELKEVLLNNK